MTAATSKRPAPDRAITDIGDYVVNYRIRSRFAYSIARQCLDAAR